MPTAINHQFNTWGRSDNGVQEQFKLLCAFIQIKKILNSLSNKYTVEKVLMLLRGIKCKAFEDHIITSELTKDQKQSTRAMRYYDA